MDNFFFFKFILRYQQIFFPHYFPVSTTPSVLVAKSATGVVDTGGAP
jgi:hypothetical protein